MNKLKLISVTQSPDLFDGFERIFTLKCKSVMENKETERTLTYRVQVSPNIYMDSCWGDGKINTKTDDTKWTRILYYSLALFLRSNYPKLREDNDLTFHALAIKRNVPNNIIPIKLEIEVPERFEMEIIEVD